MKTKHTPGPWEVRPSSNPHNGSAWRDIVSTGTEFSPAYVGEALDRDARLIAAAPDLLAALEYITRSAESGHYIERSGPEVTAARAAIAKARGEA